MRVSSIDNKYFSPTFNAMKPSQFKGVDYVCMRKLKAPIEKFDKLSDFQKWAFSKIKEKSYNFPARTDNIEKLRKDLISNWIRQFCFDRRYPFGFALVIINELCKELKPTNDDIPQILNAKALQSTYEEIKDKDDTVQFRFLDVYNKHLKSIIDKKTVPENGWLIIPSLMNDHRNYDKNTTLLQILSHRSWCTKSPYAATHLMYADFHLLMQGGKPQAILRVMEEGVVEEIQSIGNQGPILEDLPAIEQYIAERKLLLHPDVAERINQVKFTQ